MSNKLNISKLLNQNGDYMTKCIILNWSNFFSKYIKKKTFMAKK